MKLKADHFRVRPGEKVRLRKWPTRVRPCFKSERQYREILEEHVDGLRRAQERLYAGSRYALLIVLQAMDAAGKDGAISHVLSGVNPQGCEVHSFKPPSAEERAHDFLWRSACRLPERGRIGIFNRSYYEDVLIARVHPGLLRDSGGPARPDREFWNKRCRSIVDWEHHLHRNGTRIVKFFLHLSAEEQRKRFLARIDDPDKNWKISQADVTERKYWDDYRKAYEECLSATSGRHTPWYIVPADDKENARLVVSQVLLETLAALKLKYPHASPARRKELKSVRAQLTKKR